MMYWTDRCAPPRGNTVIARRLTRIRWQEHNGFRTFVVMDCTRGPRDPLLDLKGGRMFFTTWRKRFTLASLTVGQKILLDSGSGTLKPGIAYAEEISK